MGAYLNSYLEDANELMRMVFEVSAKNKTHNFLHFVEGFMKSKYRVLMDKGSTRVINMTYDELLSYLKQKCPEIFKKGNFSIDYLQAGWIGMMYNNLQFILKISSKELYELIPLDKMMKYFKTLHTISQEEALQKIVMANIKKAAY